MRNSLPAYQPIRGVVMLTNNFYTLCKLIFARPYAPAAGVSLCPPGMNFVDTTGASTTASGGNWGYTADFGGERFLDISYAKLQPEYLYREGAVYLGSGAKAATRSDYTLQSPLAASALTAGLIATDGGLDSNGHVFAEITLQLIAKQSLTIAEVGFFCMAYPPGSSSASNWLTRAGSAILIDRTVLDSPLVLQPNEVGFIKYRITNETEFPE